MANSMLSNLTFKLTDTLSTTGSSVTVSNDLERDAVITATKASVVLKNADGTIIERMQCTFATGTMTVILRGLDQSETKTEVAGLKKEWKYGTDGYVTILASDLFDIDDTTVKPVSTPIAFSGANSHSGTETFTGLIDANGGKYRGPVVATPAARDLLYPSPVSGNEVRVNSLNAKQIYNAGTAQRESQDVGTPVPDSSETVEGINRYATTAEATAGTNDATTMTPLKTKTVVDAGIVDAQELNLVSLTAGENITIGDNLCFGNTSASETQTQTKTGTDYSFGKVTTALNIGQLLTLSSVGYIQRVATVKFDLRKSGSPTDNVFVSIFNDDKVTVVENSNNLDGATLTTSYVTKTFTYSTNNLVPGKTYYYILRRSGADNDTNYYSADGGTAASYVAITFDGTDWTTQSYGLKSESAITTYAVNPASVMKMDANDPLLIQDAGIATETKTTGQAVKVQMSGVTNCFSQNSNANVSGIVYDTVSSITATTALKFTTTKTIGRLVITKDPLCTATRVILGNSSTLTAPNFLATATFSGNIAAIDYEIPSGTVGYYVGVDNNGSNYDSNKKTSPTFPVVGNSLNFTNGAITGGGDDGNGYNITSVTTYDTLTPNLYYYASDTAGALSTTPSTTYNIRIGKAISATQLLIDKKKIWNYARSFAIADAIYNGASVYYNAAYSNKYMIFYTGFRPTKIITQATTTGANYAVTTGYSDGAINKCVGSNITANTTGTWDATKAFTTYIGASTDTITGIINFLNNGFEVYYNKSGTSAITAVATLWFDVE